MQDAKFPLSKRINNNSGLVYGCMGLGGGWNNNPISAQDIKQTHHIIDVCIEQGITLFDHADIYSLGKAEKVFGEVLKSRPELTNEIAIQSKCAIRFDDEYGPKRYDFSKSWITQSVNNSLSNLNIEQLDVLMLHRPDPLMESEVIAEVFEHLKQTGKVANFGVSNMQQHQIDFLRSETSLEMVVNQVELSLSHLAWLEEGVTSGNSGEPPVNYGSGTIEYCRKNDIQLQSWGCLSQGLFSGKDVSAEPPRVQETAALVADFADQFSVSKEAIVLAWLARHPANIQPIIGTTNLERIKACAEMYKVSLTRGQWYALWVSARGRELP